MQNPKIKIFVCLNRIYLMETLRKHCSFATVCVCVFLCVCARLSSPVAQLQFLSVLSCSTQEIAISLHRQGAALKPRSEHFQFTFIPLEVAVSRSRDSNETDILL
jgi:hypothetical protein